MSTFENSIGIKQRFGQFAGPGISTVPARPMSDRQGHVHPGARKKHRDLSSRATFFLLAVAVLGFGLTTWLSWIALTSSKIPGCGGQVFDCNSVLQSKWSTFAGIPVGALASVLYMFITTTLIVGWTTSASRLRQIAFAILAVGASAAGLAAIWFISLQLFVVEHLCSWCLAVHACGLILAAGVIWLKPLGLRHTLQLFGLGFLGVAVLATGQIAAQAPPSFQMEEHKAWHQQPLSGDPVESDDAGSFLSAPGFEPSNEKPVKKGQPNVEQPNNDKNIPKQDKPSIRTTAVYGALMLGYGLHNTMVLAPSRLQDGAKDKPDLKQIPGEVDVQSASELQSEKSVESRLIGFSGGKLRLDVGQWPLQGNPNAKYVFLEMFDYTCPHCRANHQFIREAREHFGDELAVMTFSVPMNRDCNDTIQRTDQAHAEACEISRLSVAVWRLSPGQFAEFHEWLFAGEIVPSATSARAQAEELAGKDELAAELENGIAAQYIAKQVELYKMTGAGTIPKLLFTGTTVTGNIGSTEALVQVIQKQPVDPQPAKSGPKSESNVEIIKR